MSKNKENNQNVMRVDKWLWCARFFKSRSLAAAALKGGKIKLAGMTVKPKRHIQIGENLELYLKPYRYVITVKALAKSRGSATDAALLYIESGESVANRQALAIQLKSAMKSQAPAKERPDKRVRRRIIRFTRQSD